MLYTVSVALADHHTLYLTLALTRRSAKHLCMIPLLCAFRHIVFQPGTLAESSANLECCVDGRVKIFDADANKS